MSAALVNVDALDNCCKERLADRGTASGESFTCRKPSRAAGGRQRRSLRSTRGAGRHANAIGDVVDEGTAWSTDRRSRQRLLTENACELWSRRQRRSPQAARSHCEARPALNGAERSTASGPCIGGRHGDCTKGIADVGCATVFRAGMKRNVSNTHSAFFNEHDHELKTLTPTMLSVMLFTQFLLLSCYQ